MTRTRLALGLVATVVVACGIDESGTLDTSDGSTGPDVVTDGGGGKDVVNEANPPLLSCVEAGTPLDASCLGKPVPLGWQPIAIQNGVVAACGDGFTGTPLVTDPQVPTGACQCTGCSATGAWSCGVTLAGGNTCTQESMDGSASFCFQNVNHASFGETITKYGSPTCGGGQQAGFQDASSTPVSTCTPVSCESDFCGIASKGFKLCVWNPSVTDGGCPSDFPVGEVVGPKADVTCDPCQLCGLTNANAACTGTVTAYPNNNCTGTVMGSSSTSGQCASVPTGPNYNSLGFAAGPLPVPNCGAPTGTATGKPSLENPSTICCAQ